MLYSLISHNIDGKLYFTIQSLLSDTVSCVELMHGCRANFFANKVVSDKGTHFRPHYLVYLSMTWPEQWKKRVRWFKSGMQFLTVYYNYADDMVLIADSEDNLQSMLNKMFEWCSRWRIKVNKDKTKKVHFRRPRTGRAQNNFQYGGICLK